MSSSVHRALGIALVASVTTLLAGTALAVPQFTPTTGTERLHSFGSGQPGAEWDTLAASQEISYDSGTGILSISAGADVLNYWDVANGGCPTDAGSNCALNYGPNLDILFSAELVSLTTIPVAGSIIEVVLSFGTTGGTDLTITDPADGGSTQLTGVVQAGTLFSTATDGITASVFYDTGTGTVFGGGTLEGTAMIKATGGPHASLLEEDFLGIAFGSLSAWEDGAGSATTLDALIGASLAEGDLVDFSAQGEGQVFNLQSGDFVVPEPSVMGLLAFGLFGLARAGSWRR